MERSAADHQADHLCVLIHGLWGTPAHLANVAKVLGEKHPKKRLHILVPVRNSGYFTLDGVETGGERVCQEIEEEIEKFAREGHAIKRLSIVGYSLGGLVARYVIGLLYSKKFFDNIEPVSFTTFATPHLGIRTPLRGVRNQMFNVIVARTLSMSGRQLFLIDNFRETGRPLLAILADPNSNFIKGLTLFKRRILYANIINDRSAVYYTTAISKHDPFADLTKVKLNYLESYGDIILDPKDPLTPSGPTLGLPNFYSRITGSTKIVLNRLPRTLSFLILIPVGTAAFLVNSAYQTLCSTQRIRLHESGRAGIEVSNYRIPLLVNSVRETVEDAYETLSSAQGNEYLALGHEEEILRHERPIPALSAEKPSSPSSATCLEDGIGPHSHRINAPTLALTPDQFAMIQSLDAVGWRKYAVHIHNVRHSHAAIIVRTNKGSFVEGYTVLRHWVDEEFLVQ